MAEHTDPEDTLTYDAPLEVPPPVPESVEAPEPSDDAEESTDETPDPKKPRLNKGAKKK